LYLRRKSENIAETGGEFTAPTCGRRVRIKIRGSVKKTRKKNQEVRPLRGKKK
jgi:hypothetical protein